MRLEVDLRVDGPRQSAAEDVECEAFDLRALADMARSPRRLFRLLRSRSYEDVVIIEGDLPLSTVQAVCLLFLASVRAPHFDVNGRQMSRAIFAARAVWKATGATPRELLRLGILAVRVARLSRRRVALPLHTRLAARALYLRVDPTLGWMGLQVGGAATHTAGVINGLIDNGVAVEVLASARPVNSKGARFVHVPVRRFLQLVPGLSVADYGVDVSAAAAGLSADFVYERYRLGSDVGLRLAQRLAVPLVLEFNGSELWIERNWFSRRVRLGRILRRLERRNLCDASLVVVVSAALSSMAIASGARPERVLVNPNGVELDALQPYRAKSPAEWRELIGLPNEPTVGFVGTFGVWHGVQLLPTLVEAVPEARWMIVGDGPLFADVHRDISARGLNGRVTMTGLLPHEQALEILSCCDVCVSPHIENPDGTPFFGSPTKIFEYMGLRKAVVASDLGQIGEVLTHDVTALLCPPGDAAAMAAAVWRLLEDVGLRTRLADAAFELAVSSYSWTAHVRRILDALVRQEKGDGLVDGCNEHTI